MVYIGNIFKAHEGLQESFELHVVYKSGRVSTIKKTDKLHKLNGDLKLTRYYKGNFHCVVIIDCNEVESLIIKKEDNLS